MFQSRLRSASVQQLRYKAYHLQHGHRPRIIRKPTMLIQQQQQRSISIISTAARVAFRAVRLPLFVAGGTAASVTLATNKFQDLADSGSKILNDAKSFISSIGDNIEDININIPEMNIKLSDIVNDLFSSAKEKTRSINHIFSSTLPKKEQDETENKVIEQPKEEDKLDTMIAAVIQEEEEEEEEKVDYEKLAHDNDMRMKYQDHQFMLLCKKFASIREILVSIQHRAIPYIPSIVMIGSRHVNQDVPIVESILGQPFLSRQSFGDNITVEYEFVNDPDLKDLRIQLKNTEENAFYTLEEAKEKAQKLFENKDERPYNLHFIIHGSNVPYLNLSDIPEGNRDLCDKYIGQDPHSMIMAVYDTNNTNHTTTDICDRYDPLGRRTVGVLLKSQQEHIKEDKGDDEPESSASSVVKEYYPLLSLGYIDMTHVDQDTINREKEQRLIRHQIFGIIEQSMGRSIYSIVDSIKSELEETSYLFKVIYNDQQITASSYISDSMDELKLRFKDFASSLGKPQLRYEVRRLLEQNVLNICAEQYWSDAKIMALSKSSEDDFYWLYKLDLASAAITKSGIGRVTTQLVMDVIMNNMERLVKTEPFQYHPKVQKQIVDMTGDMLRLKFLATSDQVENTIKPYKYEVEVTDEEWKDGIKRTVKLLEKELSMCEEMLWSIKKNIGRKRLRSAIKRVLDEEKSQHVEDEQHTYRILEKAKETLFLQDRARILKYRLAALKSRQCKSFENKQYCPEIFLNIIAEKLTYTAVMFIQIELLNDFFFNFPVDVLDDRIVHPMSNSQIDNFAKENPSVQKHLILQDRKQKLEKVMDLLNYLVKKHDFSTSSSYNNSFYK